MVKLFIGQLHLRCSSVGFA